MRRHECQECSRTISSRDTVVVDHGRLAHLDCEKPRALNAQERALLVYYCWNHAVGTCPACGSNFRVGELASDFLDNRTYMCPRSKDLTHSVRRHLHGCAFLPREVRRRARAAREAAGRLVERSHQLRDAAEVLVQEADGALAKSWKGKRGMTSVYLPDTVDPRGPKAK